MWWISGKTTYQANLVNYIMNYKGDKYAQIIGRSDQTHRFKDSLYSSVFTQAKLLNIRYIEPWPYEFQHQTYDSLILDFNAWADANFSSSDTCRSNSINENESLLDTKVTIYPNPFSSEIAIKGESLLDKDVKLFTITGADISSSISVTTVSSQEIRLKVNSNLIPGIYFLRTGGVTKKIYKY